MHNNNYFMEKMNKDKYLNKENIARSINGIEYHPLIPFLPSGCKVLFLGSFPPQRKKWAKGFSFFYPNYINDHWRIEGLIFYNDRNKFVDEERKSFKLDDIVSFLQDKGIGFYDTATAVRRLKNNASDKFLKVVEKTNIRDLLMNAPDCKVIVTTGEKATVTLCETLNIDVPPRIGTYVNIPPDQSMKLDAVLYRLPSSSRAYPLSIEKKSDLYKKMFQQAGLID